MLMKPEEFHGRACYLTYLVALLPSPLLVLWRWGRGLAWAWGLALALEAVVAELLPLVLVVADVADLHLPTAKRLPRVPKVCATAS
jgi:hypothetical protein